MALGNLTKKEWRAIYTLRDAGREQLEVLQDLTQTGLVPSKKAFDKKMKDIEAAYRAVRKTIEELEGLFSAAYEQQNDMYQEKIEESERWANSDRASQVDSWVSALETLANPEEIPEGLVLEMEMVSYTPGGLDADADDEDEVEPIYGELPTSFPVMLDIGDAVDLYGVEGYLDEVEALDDSGASAF
jgi:hypothetical protein